MIKRDIFGKDMVREMEDIAIKVDNVSKVYKLYERNRDRIK